MNITTLLPMTALFSSPVWLVASAGQSDHRAMIFFTQILLLIVVGRLLGELMQRIGQPAVIGQLLAGIFLGPSVFGALWPAAQHMIFPTASADRQMLNAVSELGVLMLLLLTGMETDLALVKRMRRAAALTSIAGIVIPFLCGYVLGEMLPESLLPDPIRRLLTSLFLATALSISSVKIVAAVLREVDFLRRNLGQIILAAAILDDTIGWTILAFIGGLAAEGKIVMGPLLISVFGTIAFLIFCFTIGGRWVARIIRWANDHFTIEMPVISAILVIMILLAMVTNFIGVHTVLGAFVAGIMIGQSPILTQHIEEQLRGLIVALFMPVFFGVAGLSIRRMCGGRRPCARPKSPPKAVWRLRFPPHSKAPREFPGVPSSLGCRSKTGAATVQFAVRGLHLESLRGDHCADRGRQFRFFQSHGIGCHRGIFPALTFREHRLFIPGILSVHRHHPSAACLATGAAILCGPAFSQDGCRRLQVACKTQPLEGITQEERLHLAGFDFIASKLKALCPIFADRDQLFENGERLFVHA